jgi:hypothetical protein
MTTSSTCFSNEADVPTCIGHRGAAEAAPSGAHRKGWLACFSYAADVSAQSGVHRKGWLNCFSYQADASAPSGPRRMTVSH